MSSKNAKKIRFYLGLLLLSPLLAGCLGGVGVIQGISAITATSFVYTDKLPTDHLAEIATGQDCSLTRSTEDKGPICRSLTKETIKEPLYCYKELGGVTCYRHDDPYYRGEKSTMVR